jgi:hypothetical protein
MMRDDDELTSVVGHRCECMVAMMIVSRPIWEFRCSVYQLQLAEDIGVGSLAVAAAELPEDLLPDPVLPLRVYGEQEHGPDEEGGRGLLPRGEERLALVDHLVGRQRLAAAPSHLRRPRLQQQPEQVVPAASGIAAGSGVGSLGGQARLHDRHDLAPQLLVQTSNVQVTPSRQIPE